MKKDKTAEKNNQSPSSAKLLIQELKEIYNRKMTDELRTLKDISWRGIEGVTQDWVVTHEALKAEAIKWVKEEDKELMPAVNSGDLSIWKWHMGRRTLLIDFFNLTESDIKNGRN